MWKDDGRGREAKKKRRQKRRENTENEEKETEEIVEDEEIRKGSLEIKRIQGDSGNREEMK